MVLLRVLPAISFLVIAGCSDPNAVAVEAAPGKEHVFQAQENALHKARGIEQTLHDAAAQQRREIDRQDQ
jgi:hypothetical protein